MAALMNLIPHSAEVEQIIRDSIPAQIGIIKRGAEYVGSLEAEELSLHLDKYPIIAAYLHSLGKTLAADAGPATPGS